MEYQANIKVVGHGVIARCGDHDRQALMELAWGNVDDIKNRYNLDDTDIEVEIICYNPVDINKCINY